MAALLLSACGSSPPVRYYTLTDAAEGGSKTAEIRTGQPASAGFVLQILPVRVPPAIDVPQLVLRSGQGQVVMLDNDRWLGPVSDEFRSALVSQLTRTLGTAEASVLTSAEKLPVYQIQVNITRFEMVRAHYVLQDADWSLRKITSEANPEGSERVLICSSRQVIRPEDDSVAALIRAHQTALKRLSGLIAQTARMPVSHCL